MKNLLFIVLLTSYISFSQTQIGNRIEGISDIDELGHSVSLSSNGTRVAIGGLNYVSVYENQSGDWIQIGNSISDPLGNYPYRVSISSDGNIIAVGNGNGNGSDGTPTGQVKVYENQSGNWIQLGNTINGEENWSLFGSCLSLNSDGTILAIGASQHNINGTDSGQVKVYENQSGTWIQLGNTLNGLTDGDEFGFSINLNSNGNILVIGAPYSDINGNNSGQVKVYENQSNTWTQLGNTISGDVAYSNFGFSVNLNSLGNRLAVNSSDYVRVYENQSNVWTQLGSSINYPASSVCLSSDGNILATGFAHDGSNGTDSGQIRIFDYTSGEWLQLGNDINGTVDFGNFGLSVSLSSDGTIVAGGAPFSYIDFINNGYVSIFSLDTTLSTNESVLTSFNLFPNPTKDRFTIQLSEGLLLDKVNIYSSLGQLIKTTTSSQITTSNYTTGLYFVEVITNKGNATKQLIIN